MEVKIPVGYCPHCLKVVCLPDDCPVRPWEQQLVCCIPRKINNFLSLRRRWGPWLDMHCFSSSKKKYISSEPTSGPDFKSQFWTKDLQWSSRLCSWVPGAQGGYGRPGCSILLKPHFIQMEEKRPDLSEWIAFYTREHVVAQNREQMGYGKQENGFRLIF